jgi:DNA polymerase/3'-5' exonuclease PolX
MTTYQNLVDMFIEKGKQATGTAKRFKKQAYNTAANCIIESVDLSEEIDMDVINSLDCLTKNMKEKAKKIINITPDIISQLIDILGVGNALARKLVDKGVKKISDLKKKKYKSDIPKAVFLVIKYNPIRKLEYEIGGELANTLSKSLSKYSLPDEKKTISFKHIFAGSFRRGKRYLRDLDLLVVEQKGKTIDDVISCIKDSGKLVIILSKGKSKASILVTFPLGLFKVDIFYTPKSEYIPRLLYLTGSKDFNTRMRKEYKKLGMKLNEKGAFKKESGEWKKIKMHNETEEKYFSLINWPYLLPSSR